MQREFSDKYFEYDFFSSLKLALIQFLFLHFKLTNLIFNLNSIFNNENILH